MPTECIVSDSFDNNHDSPLVSVPPSHGTNQETNTLVGSQPTQSEGVTIDQAIRLCCVCRPQAAEPWSHHLCYDQ
jgi:hypothetical protein